MSDAHQSSDEEVDVPAPHPAPKEETDPQPPTHDPVSPGEGEEHQPPETSGQADPSRHRGGALPD